MKHNLKWYKLDTSAKIYPAIESVRNPSLFRVSMTLNETVKPDILLKALNAVKPRFPYYNVHLRKGIFWNYLEQNNRNLRVWKDTQSPCERIYPIFNNGYLYKVKYYRNKISLDIFHVLTDGTGAMEFLKSIVNQYLYECGYIDNTQNDIMNINNAPDEEETEDSFLSMLEDNRDILPKEKKRSLYSKNKTFQMKDRHISPGKYKVVTGVIDINEMKVLCRKYGATITQVLASMYMQSLIKVQNEQIKDSKKHRNVAIQIPVNMRNYYKTKSMRNFSLFVIPSIKPQSDMEFEDIIKAVKSFMTEHLTMEHLITMVEDNCSIAASPFIRFTPVGLKNIVIRFIANTKGSNQFSGTISNLGAVKLPDNMIEHVKDVEFVLGPATHNKSACGVSGYGGKLFITFGRSIEEAHIAHGVFTQMVEQGVNVELRSNY